MFCKAKSAKKTFFCAAILDHFQMLDHFFPLLFPKDSESLKIFDIRLREVGAKRPLNGTSTVNGQTNRQTDRQTDISTYRKHRPRGPMLWKSRIRETKHLSTDADSSTDAIGGWTKNTPKPDFFEKQKKPSKMQKLKNILKYAKISDTPFDQRSLIHREAWFPGGPRIPKYPIFFEKRKKSSKTQKFKNV